MEKKRTSRTQPQPTPRRRAKAVARPTRQQLARIPRVQMARLAHDLEVHQIELQMQNEELRESQAHLAQSRDRFNALYDFAPVGYFTLDKAGAVLEANLTVAAMLGVDRRKLVGGKFTRFVTADAQDTLYFHLRDVFAGEVRQTCELPLRAVRGAGIVVRMESIAMRDPGSNVCHCWSALSDMTARKQAEDALTRSHAELEQRVAERTRSLSETNERLRKVLQVETVGVMFWDLDTGRLTDANDTFLKMTGYSRRDLEAGQLTWQRLTRPEYVGASMAEIRQFHTTGRIGPYEKEYIRKDGTRQWFVIAGSSLGGHACVEFCVDISERKRVEAALQESEARFRQLVHSLPVAVYTCDVKGRIVLCNAAAVKLWGHEPTRGQRWCAGVRSFTPDGLLLRKSQLPIAIAVRTGESPRGSERIIERPDGSSSHVLGFPDPIRDSAGRVVGGVNVLVEVTALKQAELAVSDREERLRAILNTVVDAVITIDRRGTITSVNPATERMFGYSEKEMIGRNVKMLMPSPHPEEHDGYIHNHRRTGQTKIIGTGREVQAHRKNGAIFPVELAVSAVNRMGLFAGVIRDISVRRELETSVSEVSEREQNRIGQDLHDGLCQHLAGIEFRLFALSQSLLEKAAGMVPEVQELARLTGNAIDQTRDLAHGLSPLVLKPNGLMDALRELAAITTKAFPVSCSFHCPSPILINNNLVAMHLYRIAQEAVQNAVRHGRANVIVINLFTQNDRVVLGIKDDGIGFPKKPGKHRGMGLRIMQYRANIIAGSLVFEHGAEGGTTVICSLRAHQGGPESSSHHTPADARTRQSSAVVAARKPPPPAP